MKRRIYPNGAFKIDLISKSEAFIRQFFEENGKEDVQLRLKAIREEIDQRGTYTLTTEELTFGAKLAWRNSNRCIGRLLWKSLKVRDRRTLATPEEIFSDLLDHLDYATHKGKIRSTLSVYSSASEGMPAIRILNKQLIRYAGYSMDGGKILGDPDSVEFTQFCQSLGWKSPWTAFDVLPLVIQVDGDQPRWFEIPEEKIERVPIAHPEFPWFAEMKLQWYAVPIISDMLLEIGGITFPCAPFNGWYMLTEIAARNLADTHRYNLLPQLAAKLDLDTTTNKSLWKDKCLLILQEAVLYSFKKKGVTLVDHHTASEQFLEFCRIEAQRGRSVQADWSWIVPPTAGSTVGVFHQDWDNEVLTPNFFYQDSPWQAQPTNSKIQTKSCPFHFKPAELEDIQAD